MQKVRKPVLPVEFAVAYVLQQTDNVGLSP
jgi:hypothetical protein